MRFDVVERTRNATRIGSNGVERGRGTHFTGIWEEKWGRWRVDGEPSVIQRWSKCLALKALGENGRVEEAHNKLVLFSRGGQDG